MKKTALLALLFAVCTIAIAQNYNQNITYTKRVTFKGETLVKDSVLKLVKGVDTLFLTAKGLETRYQGDTDQHYFFMGNHLDLGSGSVLVNDFKNGDQTFIGSNDQGGGDIGLFLSYLIDNQNSRQIVINNSNLTLYSQNNNVLSAILTLDTTTSITGGLVLLPADSTAIYPTTAPAGALQYCGNCTGSGITGRIVAYISGAWRRLLFED